MTDWIVRRNRDLAEAESGDELFALNVEHGTCYGFNATANHVWKLIEQPQRLSDLRDRLVAHFDIEPDVCDRDVGDLLRNHEQEGLVSIDVPTP